MKRFLKKYVFIFVLSLVFSLFVVNNSYAETTVTTEDQLQTAINNNEDIVINSNIDITKSIKVPNTYNKTIKLNGTLKMNFVGNMFEVEGATFTFDGGVLDGNGKGRIFDIYGNSNVTIKNATIQKATTEEFQKKLDNGVNIQNYKGGAVKVASSTLNLEDVTFQENHSKNQTPDAEKPEDPRIESNGGAIYIIGSTLNIKGGKFLNNYTGTSETLNKVNGEGGAIKVDIGSKLNIDVLEKNGQEIRTLFDGNHVYHSVGNMGGFQGGAIEVSDSVANINKADFVVKGGFDTGGAIKFESSGAANNHNKITNSTFKLVGGQLPTTPVPSTHFGISGGAIMSENAFLTISNTEFTMEGKPTVAFAGGFIDVAGGGEFNLYDSKLTGNGYAWNDLSFKSAKYGGALSFENESSTKAHIKNTKFENFTVDLAGGIIAVGHSDLNLNTFGQTTVDLLMENTTLNGARAYTFNANSVGAGMYIAENSNVVIKGGKISDMSANYGGAIYNKGNLTLDDGAKIENNSTTYMAAGIYNDGYLNVHNAELKNNNKTSDNYFAGGYHQFSTGEHSGGTIYAKKDVIIGKDAVFSTGAKDDVRVIDNQSSIILSGPRNTVVNVSISEVESTGNTNFYGKEFVENAHRHVGYLVAKGLEQANLTATYKPAGLADYEATANDAQNLHYVSHTVDANKVADVNDHVGTGVWDNVFNPDNKTVVLGQRAKMVYHSNEATATLDGGVADADPAGQKLEQVYTFYDTGKVSINNVAATELTKIDKEPALAQYDFIGWYTADAKDKPKDAIDDSKKYDFANSTFSKAWNPTNAEIKDILDAGSKNTLNTYAVYERAPEKRTIEVKKEWVGTVKENTVKVQLYKNGVKEGAEVELNAANQFAHKFENLLVKDTITQPQDNVYTVKEVGEDNGRVAYGNNKYKVEYKDENGVITITNKYTPNITPLEPATKSITVNKVWVGTVQETSVKVQLYKNDVKDGAEVELNAGNNFSHKFENLKVVDTATQAQPNKYEVKEVGEANGKVVFGNNKYNVTYKTENGVVTITNKHTPDVSPLIPATKSITVNKVWVGTVKETSVKVQLYKNGAKVGNEVELNAGNNFSHKFENLKVVDTIDQAQPNKYEVKEVGEVDGRIAYGTNKYKVAYNTVGNVVTITNTHTPALEPLVPATKSITVNKTWVGTVKETSVKVQLYKNGVKEGAEVELNAGNNFSHKFENLKVVDTATQAQANSYEVKEVGEVDGRIAYGANKYKVAYNTVGNVVTITNTHTPDVSPLIPATKSITVNKTWVGAVKETSVKVQLYKNGVKEGAEVELNEGNNFSHKFENLKVVDTATQAQPNKYEVKEVGEVDGRIAYGANKYKVAYKTEGNVVTITNTHTPDVSPLIPATKTLTVNLVWEGNKEASVKVQLYKNGEKFGDEVELNEGNNFSHKFENLKVVDTLDQAKQNVYEVKEVGESDGKISFGDNNYKVTYKTEGNVVTITNTFIPKPVPQKPRLPRTGYGAGLTSVVFTISAMGLGAVSYFKKRND